jgi:hypothetical protein
MHGTAKMCRSGSKLRRQPGDPVELLVLQILQARLLPGAPVDELRGGVIDGHHTERRAAVTLDDGLIRTARMSGQDAAAP